jgi:hypothetical protein
MLKFKDGAMVELGQHNHSIFLVRYSIFLSALGILIVLKLSTEKELLNSCCDTASYCKNSGYFTDDNACRVMLTDAMDAARVVESEHTPAV